MTDRLKTLQETRANGSPGTIIASLPGIGAYFQCRGQVSGWGFASTEAVGVPVLTL